MKHREARTPVPTARSQTVRQQIVEYLHGPPVSIGVLSAEIGMAEKQLHEQLESLQKQVKLEITPARCGKCGFEFKERRRTRKPGKCPKCRSTFIEAPLFSIPGD